MGTDVEQAFDLVVNDARIVDGTGAPAVHGSVGIREGRIAEVAAAPLSGSRVLDAGGRALAPGFIDLHTHADFTLPAHPGAASMIRQGVTTQVVGNCGFSPFPAPDHAVAELRAATAWLDTGLEWGAWDDAASFLAYLQTAAPACNVAVLVGHGAVRNAVLGGDDRRPSPTELAAMAGHVEAAMRAGAVGLSTGLTYAPGVYAEPDEIHHLAAVAAAHGGFYASHMRNESSGLLESVDEILTVGRGTGVGVQISHLKALGRANWDLIDDALSRLDAAVAAGHDVLADQYPYTAGSTTLAVQTPAWARTGGTAEMQRLLRDPAARRRIRTEIAAQDPADLRAGLRVFEPEAIRLAQLPEGIDPAHEGRTVAELARIRDEEPVDTALWLLEVGGGGVLTTVHAMSEDGVRAVMRHPAVAVASDGWTLDPAVGGTPHPRSYGTFVRVLGTYVRDQGVLPLEEAVRKMTSLPARRLPGLDLGVITVGARGDLVIFDPDTVADRATFDAPHAFADGVSHVVVNGHLVVEDGVQTEARPGVVLRGRGAR